MESKCRTCAHRKVCSMSSPLREEKCSDYAPWKMDARALAEAIGLAVNCFSFDSSGFVEAMCREHRTLQQSFVREAILPYLEALSVTTHYDDRNAASVRLSRIIMERTTDEERQLPFI